ncbi:MAG: S-layer homology domain-containing protein [Oscillospiraceae bacterium]|jgi:hypothetical protein|nr:S-layer homology domain-containing protein [Oscillospiraceae bacterium]
MRKRILSLLLSAACVFSLTISAVAIDASTFIDAEDIQQQEAVTVLSALEVIDGMPDGSFSPAGLVTRAEAAKLLFVLAHGGQDAEYNPSFPADLLDISDHWAEKYITWCDKGGIIVGRGNGMFDPDGNITSLEFAKMILVLLGYNADAYRLNGSRWGEKTYELSALQDDIKLYNGLPQEAVPYRDGKIYTAAPLSRENAAQMLYNALSAPVTVFLAIWGQESEGQFVNPMDENGVITLFRAAFPAYRNTELSDLLTEQK